MPDAVRDLRPAIVRIWNYGNGGVRFGGTGVYVGNDRILTCLHTFRPQGRWLYARIEIVWPVGQKTAAAIVDYREEHDLCMLRVASPPETPAVEIAETEPQVGETLYWAGYSGSDEVDVGTGRATRVDTNLEMSTAPRHGDSGGPILNASGKLVGVVIAKDGQNTTCYGAHLVRLRSLLFPRSASPAPAGPAPGPLRKILPKVLPDACSPRLPAAPPAPAPTPAPPDPRIGEAAESLRSLDARAAEIQARAASVDGNVGKIERYLRPEESNLKPGLVILAVVLALVLGGVIFYGTQRHSPLA